MRGADLVDNMGWFSHPFHPPISYLNSLYYVTADGTVRTFLAAGPHDDLFQINTTTGGIAGHSKAEFLSKIHAEAIADDASLADLSPFEQHGGKLILVHGVADATIPTDVSVLLYSRIVEAMGQKRADGFVQLYLITGSWARGRGLQGWVRHNRGLGSLANDAIPPSNLIVIDQNKHAHRRERPMCLWQSWPRFRCANSDADDSFTFVIDHSAQRFGF